MSRSRLPNLVTKCTPRGIGNQGRPLKKLQEERDRNRRPMAYFPESEMMVMTMTMMMTTLQSPNNCYVTTVELVLQ
jgi:hypothetical protein